MHGNKSFQVADDLSMPTECDPRIDELLERREMQFLQPRNFTLRELGVGDVGQWASAPEGERPGQRRDRLIRLTCGETSTTLLEQRREALEIQLALRELQDIATAARAQPLLTAKRLTQARDMGLERLRRGDRRVRS